MGIQRTCERSFSWALACLTAIAIAASLLLISCGSDSNESGSQTATAPSTEESSTPTAEPSVDPNLVAGTFDIGSGTELYLECKGSGSPTILLEAGDEDGLAAWAAVAPDLAAETRTCAYDRQGNGRSSAASGCRQLDDLLGDLEALLEVASIDGPYVLVGASGGGFLMAGFAARHPSDVAGLVLVETPKAITPGILPPDIAAEIKCDSPKNEEHRDYAAIEHAVWDVRTEIGDFPMTIFSMDWGSIASDADQETNVEDQLGWLVLSPNSKQIVVTSGHDVANNEPDLVADEILAVLETARAGS